MSSRRLPIISLTAAIVAMVVAVGGFIVSFVFNPFFLDNYNAYGEVSIRGRAACTCPPVKSPSTSTSR
jgi:hypothetical protein